MGSLTQQPAKRPTVRDVARAAEVSVATVSRAFARPEEVNEDTRRRVLAAAEELGYRFNRLAVDFRQGRTRTIVVLVSDITNLFFSQFFKGIEEEARTRGYIALMGDTREDEESESMYVDVLTSGRADGLILNTAHFPSNLVGESSSVVLSCNPVEEKRVPVVTVDFRCGGELLADHLLQLGHTRFAAVAGRLDLAGYAERQQGFRETIEKAGFELDERLVLQGKLSIEYGMEAATALMALTPRPTAIFAHNDETALGVLYALAKCGVRVPQDISVVGFDDLSFSTAMSPALTTIRIPRREWGRSACATLLDIIESESVMVEVPPIMPELIVRESTSPPQFG